MSTSKFLCPIICTNNLSEWQALLVDGFNMQQSAHQTLSESEVKALWGLSGHTAETVLFETAGTPFGIRLLQLSPPSDRTIRDRHSGYNSNALKVIDFYTSDFEAANQQLEQCGYSLKDDIAEYDGESGKITEGHLWGPDEVVCALLSGDPNYLERFVGITDAVVSEVMSVSAPVEDPQAVIKFYQDIGFKEVFRYEVTDQSFTELVGAAQPLHIRAVNMGSEKDQPYFGIVHYGLPAGSYKSLSDRASLPNRGLVGAIVLCQDLNTVLADCHAHGYKILSPLAQLYLAPHGMINSLCVKRRLRRAKLLYQSLQLVDARHHAVLPRIGY